MSEQAPLPGGFPAEDAAPDSSDDRATDGHRRTVVRFGVAAAVVVALGAGYLVGHLGGAGTPAAPAPVAVGPVGSVPAAAKSAGPKSAAPVASVPVPAREAVVPSPPVKIEIPSIGVSDDMVALHLNPDGTLQVPTDYQQVGWYADGAVPGDTDKPPTIIAGHVDSYVGPAVFYNLRKVAVGDQVRVTQKDGIVAVYTVYAHTQYPKSTFPASEVYKIRSGSELVLLTCTGTFDTSARSYDDNYVLSARLDPKLSETAG